MTGHAAVELRPDASGRNWRRATIPFAVALFAVLVLAGSSVVAMAHRESERVEQRTGLIASEPSSSDLDVRLGDDVWGGEQFPVYWIQPAGSATPVLPPGMPRMPKQGQAAVSPALDRLASRHPGLAARYPGRMVLNPQGVGSGDELIAYVRMPEGRSLPGDLVGDLASGDTQAVRVRAFGSPSENDDVFPIVEPFSDPLTVASAVGGVIGLLVVPGLVVLVVGIATATGGARGTDVEATRPGVASPMEPPAHAALQTLRSAFPAILGVTVVWGIVAPYLERVPLVGHGVLRGDLGLPWWVLLAELSVCTGASGFAAAFVTFVRPRLATRWRREPSRRAVLTPLQAAVPFAVALVAFLLGRSVPPYPESALNPKLMLWFIGVAAALTGVVLALPVVLRSVGSELSRLRSAPARLAGRRLEHDPVRAARPFLLTAAAVVIALTGIGRVALARDVGADYSPSPVAGTQAVFVEWLDPRPNDSDRLDAALDIGLVAPFSEGKHVHGHEHPPEAEHAHEPSDALLVGATCRQIAPYFPGTDCNSEEPYDLPVWTEQSLAKTMILARHGSGNRLVLVSRNDVTVDGHLLVLDNAPLEQFEERVRAAAVQTLPGPHVYSWLATLPGMSPLNSWIIVGIGVGSAVLLLAVILSLARHLLTVRNWCRRLPGPRVPSNASNASGAPEAWRFASSFGAAVAVGFFVGLAICELMILPDVRMPWRDVGIALGSVAIVGSIGTLSAALLATGSVHENPGLEGTPVNDEK